MITDLIILHVSKDKALANVADSDSNEFTTVVSVFITEAAPSPGTTGHSETHGTKAPTVPPDTTADF